MTAQYRLREEEYFDWSTHVLQLRNGVKSSTASIEEVQASMNFTKIFLEYQLTFPCLVLCNWAIDNALRTFYMKKHRQISPPYTLSLNQLLELTRDSRGHPDLETVNFMESIRFLVNSPDMALHQPMNEGHLINMIRRADKLVYDLYLRSYGAEARYKRVF
ncbi:hypothetical protein GRF59_26790 [Paenibacillus sp. HJL G12]|uniref:Uncharacterized protein n=1 Tax=Paenibacillus dendrobii TaxID=2691084 RepID=A0A7X3IPS2_9BACL|nr:hypothetical protein [Paenibacillus dendrobii]MWV47206.1 hypothetical protein [Paenibacillus dendrobii]